MAAKKAAAKKTTATKTAAKKAPAKRAARRTAAQADKELGIEPKVEAPPVEAPNVVSFAERALAGEFGTGRDRDTALRALGVDPAAVAKASARIMAEKARSGS